MDFKCFVPDCKLQPHFDWVFDQQHTYSCQNHQIHDQSTFTSRQELPGIKKIILKHSKPRSSSPLPLLLFLPLLTIPLLFLLSQNNFLNTCILQVQTIKSQTSTASKSLQEFSNFDDLVSKLSTKPKKQKPIKTFKEIPQSPPAQVQSKPIKPAPISKAKAIEELSRADLPLNLKTDYLQQILNFPFDDKQSEVLSLSFTSNSSSLLFGTMSGLIKQVNLSDLTTDKLLSDRFRIYNLVDLARDSSIIISSNSNLQEFNTRLRTLAGKFQAHSNWILSARLSTNRSMLATGSCDNMVKLWQLPGYKPLATFQGHSGDVWSVDFSHNSSLLASSDESGQIFIWDLNSLKLVKSLKASSSAVYSVKFSPDSARLYTASGDGKVRLWDLKSGINTHVLPFDGMVRAMALTANGEFLLAVAGKLLSVWDLRSFSIVRQMQHGASLKSVVVCDDSLVVATGDDSNRVWLWEVYTGRLVAVFGGFVGGVQGVLVMDYGKKVAVADRDVVRIWDVESTALVEVVYDRDEWNRIMKLIRSKS